MYYNNYCIQRPYCYSTLGTFILAIIYILISSVLTHSQSVGYIFHLMIYSIFNISK